MDDVAGQHLLDLRHLLPPNSRVLPLVGLAERWSLGFNGVFEQWSAAEIVLSLAEHVTELLEEVVQLLLLELRQVLRYGRLTHRFGPGG